MMNKQFEAIRPVVRSMPWDGTQMSRELLLTREWLVTNGLGGYASGTVSGAVTRRYHGLLIAALPGPLGRILLVDFVGDAPQRIKGRHQGPGEHARAFIGQHL